MLKPTRVVNYLTMKGVAQEIYIRRMAALNINNFRSDEHFRNMAESEASFALSAAESFTDAFNKRCALETSDV
jgi:precorrin-4 methylase